MLYERSYIPCSCTDFHEAPSPQARLPRSFLAYLYPPKHMFPPSRRGLNTRPIPIPPSDIYMADAEFRAQSARDLKPTWVKPLDTASHRFSRISSAAASTRLWVLMNQQEPASSDIHQRSIYLQQPSSGFFGHEQYLLGCSHRFDGMSKNPFNRTPVAGFEPTRHPGVLAFVWTSSLLEKLRSTFKHLLDVERFER
ncbi:hypothetical protein FB45DRAFT_1104099 [Roridomyces roridus]|uniref:Uncharacterized protein n=1 Tax=Roridomyces roridus TaxID=1738132 RepID=A0AAD7FD63_9AGAR|nr:hypothetical protein FB45DRAFT_1104099 [Roridomyces roridus]